MRILAIGDVVGNIGCRFLRQRLPALKKLKGVDLVIANGENSQMEMVLLQFRQIFFFLVE